MVALQWWRKAEPSNGIIKCHFRSLLSSVIPVHGVRFRVELDVELSCHQIKLFMGIIWNTGVAAASWITNVIGISTEIEGKRSLVYGPG